MATEAEALSEALSDLQRISRAVLEAIDKRYDSWAFPDLTDREAEALVRGVVADLLHDGLIKVGRRPQTGPAPMKGQTTIQEAEHAAEARQ